MVPVMLTDLTIDGEVRHDSLPGGKSDCSLALSGRVLVARLPSGEVLKLDLRRAEFLRGGSDGSDFVFASTVLGGPTFVSKNADLYRAAMLACPNLRVHTGARATEHVRRLSTFQRVALGLATAVVLSVLGAILLVGPLAGVALRLVPRWVDVQIGKAAYPNAVMQVGLGWGVREEAAIREPVQAVLDRLLAAVPNNPYTFHVTVCNSPMLNAFALPGGEVLITTHMLTSLESADELAAVLAHEVSHVLRRHAIEMTIKASGVRFLVHVASGGHVAMGIATSVWGAVTVMGESRDKEGEADRYAVHLLIDAGLDPKTLLSMFGKLAAEDPPALEAASGPSATFFEKMRSHPHIAQRIADVEEEIARSPVVSPMPIEVDYPALVKAVRDSNPADKQGLPPLFRLLEVMGRRQERRFTPSRRQACARRRRRPGCPENA
jgi:beta-barrel assembly-enhancing protease